MFANVRQVTIEWGDCDPAGIVFNPRYFEMFDAATAGLISAALGEDKFAIRQRFDIVGFPLVATQARFLLPNRYGHIVAITTQVTRFGRTSFDVSHRLTRDDAASVDAQETRVWAAADPADPSRAKGVPIPAEVITALSRPN